MGPLTPYPAPLWKLLHFQFPMQCLPSDSDSVRSSIELLPTLYETLRREGLELQSLWWSPKQYGTGLVPEECRERRTSGNQQVFHRGDRSCVGELESLGQVRRSGSPGWGPYTIQMAEGMGHIEEGDQSPLFCIVPRKGRNTKRDGSWLRNRTWELKILDVPLQELRIQHCHSCGIGRSCGSALVPGLDTYICQKTKINKQKELENRNQTSVNEDIKINQIRFISRPPTKNKLKILVCTIFQNYKKLRIRTWYRNFCETLCGRETNQPTHAFQHYIKKLKKKNLLGDNECKTI